MSFTLFTIENSPQESLYNEALGKYGINVLAFSSPGDALEKLDEKVSLILFEHDGKKLDGLSFLRGNREKINSAFVIILSKKPDIGEAVAFIKEGALDYLTKPIEKAKLDSFARFVINNKKNIESKTKATAKTKTIKSGNNKIIGSSEKIQEIINLCSQVAKGKSTVLIQGESGTGKEMIARLIHQESPRVDKPFVAVNCAAFPEGLLESELFGHQKGAFTGAIEKKMGKMELANGGTILFDEISEMDVLLQAKLLRAIQEKEIDPVGGKKPISVDVRIIATTNRNLKKHIDDGKFREDLYYRLNVIPIKLPTLRERKDDIPILVKHFIKKHCRENGLEIKTISKEAMDLVVEQNWPGNIRELENVVERAVIISPSNNIEREHIFLETDSEPSKTDSIDAKEVSTGVTMAEMEKKLILKTLDEVQNNRQRAAEALGIHVRTLRNKLNEYKNEDKP